MPGAASDIAEYLPRYGSAPLLGGAEDGNWRFATLTGTTSDPCGNTLNASPAGKIRARGFVVGEEPQQRARAVEAKS